MSEQTGHKVDRAGWPAGPWDAEPEDRPERAVNGAAITMRERCAREIERMAAAARMRQRPLLAMLLDDMAGHFRNAPAHTADAELRGALDYVRGELEAFDSGAAARPN